MLFRRREDGYNLVILIILITLLNVMMAAALPVWSKVSQRDKEEELIFRGLQYAEAIRVFRTRYNRYPVSLKELIEVEPRCIRQLWKDPMTENGKWGLIFAGATPGQGRVAPGATPPGQAPGSRPGAQGPGDGDHDDAAPGRGGGIDAAGRVTVGPIQGVFSRSDESSIKVFLGQTQYSQWRFTEQLVLASVGVRGAGANLGSGSQIPNLSVRWVGRPLPSFIPQSQVPQPGGGPQGGQRPQNLAPSSGVVGTPRQLPSNPRASPEGQPQRRP